MKEATKEQTRLNMAIGAMPYGVGIMPRVEAKGLTLDIAAAYLEALAERLANVAERHTKDAEQLARYKADVEAVRRVLGVPS